MGLAGRVDATRERGIAMIWRREPVLIQGAVIGVLNLVSSFGWLPLTPAQMGAVNTALAGVLALVTRQVVTPVGRPPKAGPPEPGRPAVPDPSTGDGGPASGHHGPRAPGLG